MHQAVHWVCTQYPQDFKNSSFECLLGGKTIILQYFLCITKKAPHSIKPLWDASGQFTKSVY